MRLKSKLWKIVPLALLTIMLFSAMASANVDVQTYEQEDSVRFVITNVGEVPTYVLNALLELDKTGNTIKTSQELSSAELLRILPGKSYTFELNTDDLPEGEYTGKIYHGDDRRDLRAISKDFLKARKPGKPIFYTDKKLYKYGKKIDVTFQNMGFGTIYPNVNNWEITSLDTGNVVYTLSKDCPPYGYGGSCEDFFERLRFMDDIEQTWDQKDSSGNQVASGRYEVTAEYSLQDPSSGTPDIKTISTKTFFIMPNRR